MTFLLVVVMALLAWGIILYNRLVRDRNRVATAWSDIDVQLKRRHDLIPKLVAAVEQYARYERSTLQTIVEIRAEARDTGDVGARGELEKLLGQRLHRLIALAEDYPDLKADQSFLQLQNDLTDTENHIQYARRFYNGAVRNLNTRIDSFPDLLLARLFRFRQQSYFELDSPVEADPPEGFNQ
ncbi:MAG: hypothetical protein C0615_08905 [Desulfuromonas sp.]|nr:MAG: hypothetical protein C0615_08905 [Desulfuromonas sp.]